MLCFRPLSLLFNFFTTKLSGGNTLFSYKMAGREQGPLAGEIKIRLHCTFYRLFISGMDCEKQKPTKLIEIHHP